MAEEFQSIREREIIPVLDIVALTAFRYLILRNARHATIAISPADKIMKF